MLQKRSDPLLLAAGGALLLLIGWLSYTQQMVWLFLPLAVVTAGLLLQYPIVLFYTLMASIPWSMEYTFRESLGTDLPDEPLMLLAALAALLLIAFRWKQQQALWRNPLVALLLLQWLWVLATALVATDLLVALKQALARGWYLLAFVALPVQLWKEEKVMKRAVGILFLSMMLAMVLALFRHAGMGFRFESVNTALEPFFRNHVNYSALLVAMVPVNILLWQQASRPFQRNMLGLLLAVLLAALYVSYARGAWLALFTGMTAYVLVRRKMLVTAFLAMILLSLATVWWLQRGDRYLRFAPDYNHTVFHSDFGQHLVATYQLKDLSTAERFYRWIAGARLATDHWMTGTGPGTFYLNYKPYAIPAYKTWVSSNEEHSTVHNYFLLTLIEQGVAGLVLLLLLWLALLYYAQTLYQRLNDRFWKQVVAAVAAVLTMVATVNFLSDLIETDKVGPIFYMCAALLITVDYRSKNLNSSSHIQGIAEPVSE